MSTAAVLDSSDDWAARYGPWALVTGASDGLGRAFARRLAERKLNLVLVARRIAALSVLAEELQVHHAIRCVVIPMDLGDPRSVASLDEQTQNLDIGLVVAAAGFGSIGSFLDRSLKDEADMLAVNAGSVLRIAHHFGNRLAARRSGGLVLFGSVVGFQGTPLSANYAATKAYVQSLAEALAVEWDQQGVDVLSCAPGPVATGFAARAGMTMGKAADPDDLVEPCLEALGRRTTVRPGWLAKLLGHGLGTLPRALRVRVMRGVMRGMQPSP
jgi:short-subunit dehydrogenase